VAIDVRGLTTMLSVFDMPTSIKFYCDGLGFEIISTDSKTAPEFDWVMLRANTSELMLNTAYEENQRPQTSDRARVAAHRDTVIYFGCPNVEGAYTHLQSMGINMKEPKIAWYGMKQLYVTDPDGYLLCFQWRTETQTNDS